jgi:prolyl-tRNA synthetase
LQTLPYDRALARQKAKEIHVDSWDDFTDLFQDTESSFVWAHWDGTSETELAIKDATKATIRCIPYEGDGPPAEPGVCIKTGKASAQRVLFSKNY